MSDIKTTNKLHPGSAFPQLSLMTVDGQQVVLGEPRKDKVSSKLPAWQMIVVYRGQHCPMCTRYLNSLVQHTQQLADSSIDVIAVSMDTKEKLDSHAKRTQIHHLENINYPIAYGLTIEQAETLGVYISRPRNEQETNQPFAEPAIFVVNGQGNLQVVDYSNNPFARPEIGALVAGLCWFRQPENRYPIRGTYPDAQDEHHEYVHP